MNEIKDARGSCKGLKRSLVASPSVLWNHGQEDSYEDKQRLQAIGTTANLIIRKWETILGQPVEKQA